MRVPTTTQWLPLPWQAEALGWLLDAEDTDFLAINGGIGCGKSELLAVMLHTYCMALPGVQTMLVSDSWPSLRVNNLGYLHRHCGRVASWRAADKEYVYPSGSKVILKHYGLSSGAKESENPLEGASMGLLVVDEAQKLPPVVLDHIAGRMRGAAALTDAAGFKRSERAVLNGRPDRGDWWWERAVAESGGAVIKPKTRDNPHNGARYLERLARQLSPAMFRCVTEGIPAPAEGGVYDVWREDEWPAGNIVDGWRYDVARPVHIGVDFGRRTPAVVWVQQDEAGRWVIFDETAPDECSTPQLVARILRPWSQRWPGIDRLYGAAPVPWRLDVAYADPAGNAANVQTGLADIALLRRAQGDATDGLGGGLGCLVMTTTDAARTGVSAGCERVRGMMAPARGEPRLVMTRELWDRGLAAPQGVRTLSRSLMAYTWEHVAKKGRGAGDHWSTHHCDALRYWAIGAAWSAGAYRVPPGAAYVPPPSSMR